MSTVICRSFRKLATFMERNFFWASPLLFIHFPSTDWQIAEQMVFSTVERTHTNLGIFFWFKITGNPFALKPKIASTKKLSKEKKYVQPFPNYKVLCPFSNLIDQAEGNLLTSLSDKIWWFGVGIRLLHHFQCFLCPVHDHHIGKPLLSKINARRIKNQKVMQRI